jgi:hypothetical protein
VLSMGGKTEAQRFPTDVHQDRQDITSLEPPVDASSCKCQACGPQQSSGLDVGSSGDRCSQPFQKRYEGLQLFLSCF